MPATNSFPFHPLDIILGLMLLYSCYRGYKTGLILVIINTIALFLAVAAGFIFLDEASHFLSQYMEKASVFLSVVAFLVVFILFFFGLKWFGALMSSSVRRTLIGPFDQVAGSLLGLFRMAFLLGSLIFGMEIIGVRLQEHLDGKLYLFPLLRDLGPGCINILTPLMPFLREIMERKGVHSPL